MKGEKTTERLLVGDQLSRKCICNSRVNWDWGFNALKNIEEKRTVEINKTLNRIKHVLKLKNVGNFPQMFFSMTANARRSAGKALYRGVKLVFFILSFTPFPDKYATRTGTIRRDSSKQRTVSCVFYSLTGLPRQTMWLKPRERREKRQNKNHSPVGRRCCESTVVIAVIIKRT